MDFNEYVREYELGRARGDAPPVPERRLQGARADGARAGQDAGGRGDRGLPARDRARGRLEPARRVGADPRPEALVAAAPPTAATRLPARSTSRATSEASRCSCATRCSSCCARWRAGTGRPRRQLDERVGRPRSFERAMTPFFAEHARRPPRSERAGSGPDDDHRASAPGGRRALAGRPGRLRRRGRRRLGDLRVGRPRKVARVGKADRANEPTLEVAWGIMRVLKRVLKVVGLVVVLLGLILGMFVYVQCSKFDSSMEKVYDVPAPDLGRSTDAAVIARGDHLVHSLGGCASALCHGEDLGRRQADRDGAPRLAPGAEHHARQPRRGVLRRRIRADHPARHQEGRADGAPHAVAGPHLAARLRRAGNRLLPADGAARRPARTARRGSARSARSSIAWTRSSLDVARRIDHGKIEHAPAPEPTAAYGAYVSRLCNGCHGEHLSGGRIPGTPSTIPTPLNLTPDATGLKDWSFADFDKLMKTGARQERQDARPVHAHRGVEELRRHRDARALGVPADAPARAARRTLRGFSERLPRRARSG